MNALTKTFFCLPAFVFFSCSLVDESYATLGRKSINGTDVFYSMLNGKDREARRYNFMSEKILKEADLIVHFETRVTEAAMKRIEAWLLGIKLKKKKDSKKSKKDDPKDSKKPEETIDPDDKPGETIDPDDKPGETIDPDDTPGETIDPNDKPGETIDPDDTPGEEIDPDDAPTEKPDMVRRPAPAPQSATGRRPAPAPQSVSGLQRLPSLQRARKALFQPGDAKGEVPIEPKSLRGERTLLYFVRDTDASVNFWQILAEQMRDHPVERQYCEQQLMIRKLFREVDARNRILFGERQVVYPDVKYSRNLRYNPQLFPQGIRQFPVRTVVGAPFARFPKAEFTHLTIASTNLREVLIREFKLKNARLILVYNAQPFLNHALVDPGNRMLAQDLIRLALKKSVPGSKQKIALIEHSLLMAENVVNEEENMLRIFKAFPINFIILHLIVLLILFLYSRWPHEKSPLEAPAPGNREFIEHIRALGLKLSRSRDRLSSVESLIRLWMHKGGESKKQIFDESLGVSAELNLLKRVSKLWDQGTGSRE